MKILYLITGLRMGGAENQLLLISSQMQLAGAEVLVVAMESGGVLADKFREKNINVIELDIKGLRTLSKGYGQFKSTVKKFSPDVIHSHMVHANLFVRFFKLFNKGFKLICTAHNIREGNKLLMECYRLTSGIPDWCTNVSKEAFESFITKKYFSLNKSSYISNAIDTALFDPARYNRSLLRNQFNLSNNTFVYFSAGRLHPQKNQQILLDAFKIVQEIVTDTFLIIAGDGPLLHTLEEQIKDLNIAHKTLLLGSRNDISALMSMCDCFVLSSRFEGFGLVVGEAMAMQKPIVATDCGGVKEVMGGFGQLVAVDDKQGIVNAMIKAKQIPFTEAYLNNGRLYIEANYSVPLIMNKWKKLYSNQHEV